MSLTRPTLLLTRPQEEAQETAAILENKGYHILFLPLFEAMPLPFSKAFLFETFKALMVTSQRALQMFATASPERSLPVYTVGDQTAALARNLGFTQVVSAQGNALDLARLLMKECRPEQGTILYIRGAQTAHDLAAFLSAQGFQVHQETLYTMEPLVFHMPESLKFAFRKQAIAGSLFFSAQTALAFSRLIQQAGLGENCEIGYLFCLSEAVAKALNPLSQKIKIAKQPTQASLLEIVYETIPSSCSSSS